MTDKKELDNVAIMLDRMPDAGSVNHNLSCKFDRGYGKEDITKLTAKKGYKITTIAAE